MVSHSVNPSEGDTRGCARYHSSEYTDLGGEQAMDLIVVRSVSLHVTFTLVAPDLSKNPGTRSRTGFGSSTIKALYEAVDRDRLSAG